MRGMYLFVALFAGECARAAVAFGHGVFIGCEEY